MMTDARVMLKNPNTGRDDLRIAREMYEPVADAIVAALAAQPGLAFGDLRSEVECRTPASMWESASVGWYTTSVKLDLEARGLVRREGSPQRLFLAETEEDFYGE